MTTQDNDYDCPFCAYFITPIQAEELPKYILEEMKVELRPCSKCALGTIIDKLTLIIGKRY